MKHLKNEVKLKWCCNFQSFWRQLPRTCNWLRRTVFSDTVRYDGLGVWGCSWLRNASTARRAPEVASFDSSIQVQKVELDFLDLSPHGQRSTFSASCRKISQWLRIECHLVVGALKVKLFFLLTGVLTNVTNLGLGGSLQVLSSPMYRVKSLKRRFFDGGNL